MLVLVVDDSAAARELLAEHLTQLGFEVEQAVHGADALEKIPELPQLAAVMLDWSMPEMSGLEVLRRIRADERCSEVPVLMVTTDAELPFVDEALAAGASEYLLRPFDAQTVLEKLLLLGVDPEMRRAA